MLRMRIQLPLRRKDRRPPLQSHGRHAMRGSGGSSMHSMCVCNSSGDLIHCMTGPPDPGLATQITGVTCSRGRVSRLPARAAPAAVKKPAPKGRVRTPGGASLAARWLPSEAFEDRVGCCCRAAILGVAAATPHLHVALSAAEMEERVAQAICGGGSTDVHRRRTRIGPTGVPSMPLTHMHKGPHAAQTGVGACQRTTTCW
mmetsp:Transcript_10247/g.27909  ORF Transcript_10247/g.27909 Transcript_10247/m.27909 type:complete len:201 (+) Transcript_10247:2801-3403(+)